MRNLRSFTIIAAVLLCLTGTAPSHAVTYFSVAEILKQFYPQAESIKLESNHLSDEQRANIKKIVKRGSVSPDWSVHVARRGSKVLGYVIVDNVLGREKDITYAVNITPSGTVKEIEVLVYRESYGDQVKNSGFRKQFVGKSIADPVAVGKDIQFVSGATISSRSLAFGVKRALAVWQQIYGK